MEDKKLEELTIEQLKEKALLYGLEFKGNISKDKLMVMLDAAQQVKTQPVGVSDDTASFGQSDDDELYSDGKINSPLPTRGEVKELKKQALMRLRIIVTNLNSEESDEMTVYSGVVSNYFVAARYIPLDKPWPVEQCLVDKLMTEKFQSFVNEIDPRTRRPNGNKVAKLNKHYNIQFV